eukprot:COSAG01_NODE_2032_length_8583_cov_14.706271_7_plen_278_part_00
MVTVPGSSQQGGTTYNASVRRHAVAVTARCRTPGTFIDCAPAAGTGEVGGHISGRQDGHGRGQAAPSARAPLPPRWPPAAASCTHCTTRAQGHCVIHRCTLSTAQQRIAPRVTSGVSCYLDGLIWALSGRDSAQPSTSELAHTSVFFGPGWPATYPQPVFCSWRACPPRTRACTAPHHPLLCSGVHQERPASHSACARHRATARHMRPRWRGTTVRALPRQGSYTRRHDGPLLGVVSAFGGSGAPARTSCMAHQLATSRAAPVVEERQADRMEEPLL